MTNRTAGALTATIVGLALLIVVPAAAMPADTAVTIDGGGWGHGIGMPQWGAQGMAEHGGHSYDQILAYWYEGTGLRPASAITPAVPDTIRVGIHYVQAATREFRPFRWLDFQPVNGPIEVCLAGEEAGACSFLANPGETWRYRWFDQDGGSCVITRNESPVYSHGSDCTVRLFWSDQPNTRVAFPGGDVGRTFARGHIAFLGPVTVNAQTGFHLNIVVPLDEYVYGIAEVPPSWHMEALKAQAVAARTYGAWKAQGGIKGNCSCHVVWDTSDQAYRGWHHNAEAWADSSGNHRWRQAVDATAGQVVVHPAGSSSIAQTYYSSSSGGATENVGDVWNSNQALYPYLVTKPDPWSSLYAPVTPTSATTIRWRFVLSAGQIVSALAGGDSPAFPGLTELVSMSVEERNPSGSPRRIRVTGVVNGRTVFKDFVSRSPTASQGTIGLLVSRLGLRGHFIHSISASSSSGAGFPGPASISASVGYHDPASGIYSLHLPGGGTRTFYFGNPADIPFVGDWTCDGVSTPGLYRMSTGFLFLRNTNTQGVADTAIYFGNPGDVPVAGDWNGNGCETVGVYRPSAATFYLRNTNTQGVADLTVPFGNRGDVPLVGDWDGNGVTTVGVYRPSTRMVYLSNSPNGSTVDIAYFYSGAQAGDRIIVGDWNGNGIDTLGVYRPSTATFFLRNGYGPGGADHVFTFGPTNRTPLSGKWG
jgi:peptidoglycan hydrolase-like amidase